MGKLIADETRHIYITGLHNAHAMETQAIELLTRQSERLENYPEMEAHLRAHLEESKVQRTRLEEVMASLDEKHSALKEAILGMGGNIAAFAHTAASDEIIKNTLANYMFEHFEIAAYKSLIAMADYLGHSRRCRRRQRLPCTKKNAWQPGSTPKSPQRRSPSCNA